MEKGMEKLVRIFLIVLMLGTFFCAATFAQKTEDRNLSSFSAVKVSGGFNVVIQQGNSEHIEITASGIDLQDIITEVEGGTLKIRTKNDSWNWKNKYEVSIVLTYKTLESVTSSGSSHIKTKSAIKNNQFELVLSGSGKFRGEVDTQKLAIVISGSGDVELSGSAKEQSIEVSGSGDVEALALQSSIAKIRITGSGNAKVSVSEQLDGRVSGSGDIRFAGNPEKQIFKTTGSGSIKKIN
ncbi:MAG: DUF2807 domain-containing protein [Cytophagales bacterium]|nr:MAG: DUF2807 domain-containing protein [Cytophagales bacterium]